jgi:hypothetical protein
MLALTNLSVGTHAILATVTDSVSQEGPAGISLTVEAAATNTAPVVSITSPADESVFTEGAEIQFAGTADDAEEGDLSGSIQWSSDLDGSLGAGATLALTNLSVGTHAILATVTDSDTQEGTAGISLTVEAASGEGVPVVNGLVLHLESDEGVISFGALVTGWTDLSGQQNNLFASGDPQLLTAGTPGGRPAIQFDGNGDKLERLAATHPLGGLPSGNEDRTMFLVAKYDGSKAWGGAPYGTGANNQTFGLVVRHPTGTLTLQGWGSGNDLVSSTMGIGAGWLVQSGVLNAGTGRLYKDGAQIKQWSHTYNTVLTKVVIGEEIKNLGFMDVDVKGVSPEWRLDSA